MLDYLFHAYLDYWGRKPDFFQTKQAHTEVQAALRAAVDTETYLELENLVNFLGAAHEEQGFIRGFCQGVQFMYEALQNTD